MAPPSIDQVLQHFSTAHSLHIRPTFLSGLLASLSTERQVPPGPAFFATLKFRVLASDITESLQPHANLCFPVTATSADVQSATLPGPVAVQVVGLEDMGTSRIQQIERIEMGERGEVVKGREVIRVVPSAQGESGEVNGGGAEGRRAGQPTGKEGPYKVLVEDAGGRRVFGIELKSVPGIKSDMPMGTKMVLRNIIIARGVLLLSPANTVVLGGKVEALNQQYLAGKKAALHAAIERINSQHS